MISLPQVGEYQFRDMSEGKDERYAGLGLRIDAQQYEFALRRFASQRIDKIANDIAGRCANFPGAIR